jgi:MFS transporter, DHA2 family, multidrug resistance protein
MNMSVAEPTVGQRTEPRENRSSARWWALAALTLSILAVGLDTYVLVTALPTLSSKLGASTSQLQWITAAYTLAWVGLLLPAGKLGDRIGRRKILLAGLTIFGVSSVVASRVNSPAELIGMRAVMGIGAAMILPMALAILPALFPESGERQRAVAVTTVGTMLGLPLGPLLGGWLLTHFAWGSIFLINGPVVVLSLLGVWFLVPESKDPTAPRLDWPGAVLAAAGVTGVVYGVIEQPSHGWTDLGVLAGLIGGAVILAGFVLRQRRADSPLVDLRLFLNPRFTWATIAFAVVSFAMSGVLFVLTPYLQVVQGSDAQGTGLRLLPMIGAMLVGAAVSGKSAALVGSRTVISIGMLISGAGLVVLTFAHAGSGYGIVALALAIFGLGLGLSLPLSVDAVLEALPANQTGIGNGLSRTLQSVGIAFGAAILGSILNGAYRRRMNGQGLPASAKASVAGAHAVAHRLQANAGRALSHAADHAYVHGMAQVLFTGTGVLAVTAVLVLMFLPGHTSNQSAAKSGRGK